MLAILERENFSEEIENKEGAAIYLYMSDHVGRVLPDMRQAIRNDAPYYYLNKENEIVSGGFFSTGRPFVTHFYKLLKKSYFVNYLGINLPKRSKEQTYLMFKIIEQSRKAYDSRFNGTFYVLIHPLSFIPEEADYLSSLLSEVNITVLRYSDYPIAFPDHYVVPGDDHPNKELNKLLANYIEDSLMMQPSQ